MLAFRDISVVIFIDIPYSSSAECPVVPTADITAM